MVINEENITLREHKLPRTRPCYHLLYLGINFNSMHFYGGMLCRVYPENLIGEGLTYGIDIGKVEYNDLEQLYPGEQAFCL